MFGHKYIDLTENKECRCFESSSPQYKYFLSKFPNNSQTPQSSPPTTIPPHIQQSLAKVGLKKSLKRNNKLSPDISNGESPYRRDKCADSYREPQLNLRDVRSCDARDQVVSLSPSSLLMKSRSTAFLAPPSPSPRIIVRESFPRSFPVSSFVGYHSNNSISVGPPLVVASSLKPKINFSIMSQPQRTVQKIPIATHAPVFFQKEEKITQDHQRNPQKREEQQQQDQKEEKKSKNIKKKMSIEQRLSIQQDKSSLKGSGRSDLAAFEEIDVEIVESMDLQHKFKPARKKELRKEKISIFQSVPAFDKLPMNKSGIKDDPKNKLGFKKWKTRPVLNRMSDVEEIHSEPDEEEIEESDKESVVLGRLEKQSSVEFTGMNIPKLEKGFQDNHSFNSTIMSTQNDRHRPKPQMRDLII